ncbi:MAG: V-type ATP synthase subunit D [Thermoplasmata archaeon]|nr:MAG: V-type ATP synthase subunit D [Thermoplasmata archaeon]
MSEQLLEGIKPTRMELLAIRKKLTLAQKGHKLLEEKRDALVERFFGIIDKRNELKKEIDSLLSDAYLSLIQAEMIMGEKNVEVATKQTLINGELTFTTDNIMGVKIPKINSEQFEISQKPNYGFSNTTPKLDDAHQQFTSILKHLIELADLEGGIKSLAIEIEKTKRRVNVLENNLIPKLKSTRKYIEMQLEEREREDFFRRKRIKAIMESKAV